MYFLMGKKPFKTKLCLINLMLYQDKSWRYDVLTLNVVVQIFEARVVQKRWGHRNS